jgi:hypothetical protein
MKRSSCWGPEGGIASNAEVDASVSRIVFLCFQFLSRVLSQVDAWFHVVESGRFRFGLDRGQVGLLQQGIPTVWV